MNAPATPSPLDGLIARLSALHPKRIDLSLDRMQLLLQRLDHPDRNLPPVNHIAGTQRNGSTLDGLAVIVLMVFAAALMDGIVARAVADPWKLAGFIAGIVFALVLALLTKINLDLAAPWTHTHTLAAEVSDVDGISISSDVRIAGRIVGQITDVQAKGSYSMVTFPVRKSMYEHSPPHSTTTLC